MYINPIYNSFNDTLYIFPLLFKQRDEPFGQIGSQRVEAQV